MAGLVHERLAERPDGVAAAQQDAVVQHDAVGGDVEGELEGEGGPGADAAVPEAAVGVSWLGWSGGEGRAHPMM